MPRNLANTLFKTLQRHTCNNLQGVFPTMIDFVTLGDLLYTGDDAKRWQRVTKQMMVGKTP